MRPHLQHTVGLVTALALLASPALARKPATDIAPGGPASALPEQVDIHAAQRLIQAQPELLVLDVRTGREFAQGHLAGALNIPVQELGSRVDELARFRDRPLLVYCRTQNRSAVAHRFLSAQGFRATYMLGGFSAWQRAGLPSNK